MKKTVKKATNKTAKKLSKPSKRPAGARAAAKSKITRNIIKSAGVKKQAGKEKKAPSAGKPGADDKAAKSRIKINANVYPPDEVKRVIDELSGNESAVGYLKKNVSKRALDVMTLLTSPKTDEALAEELDMKINAVRRILNIMQGYGITNYYVSKNVNGWLSFAWYINVGKLKPFFEYIESIETKKPIVNGNCNDYFVCDNCYEKTKLIFTFDAAFEENFKCGSCGDGLIMIDRDGAASLVQKENIASKALSRAQEAPTRVGTNGA